MDFDKPVPPIPERWNSDWIRRRHAMEVNRLGYTGQGLPPNHLRLPLPYRCLSSGLKALGLYRRGYRNFRTIGLSRIRHDLRNWPGKLAGFRILHLSDLHIDLDPGLEGPLLECVRGVKSDLVVFTGDYWEGANTSFDQVLLSMDKLLKAIPEPACGTFGVLGNHDPVALGARLEAMGLRILLNEGVRIGTDESPFALAGIDDPYYFRGDDVGAAARDCPEGLPSILLSHSPEIAREAAAAGFDLMLSGHTHGGQVCLPGGQSLVKMDRIPRKLFKGSWQMDGLRGYTTSGAGACHVPVRFNCPAEVVLHELYPA
jgi:predicted MPP superfamily phosphohydrolase